MSARIDRIASVLEEHMLTGPAPGQCRCGWGREVEHLGKSHPEHVARMLDAALGEADQGEVAEVVTDHVDASATTLGALVDDLFRRYHLIPKGNNDDD